MRIIALDIPAPSLRNMAISRTLGARFADGAGAAPASVAFKGSKVAGIPDPSLAYACHLWHMRVIFGILSKQSGRSIRRPYTDSAIKFSSDRAVRGEILMKSVNSTALLSFRGNSGLVHCRWRNPPPLGLVSPIPKFASGLTARASELRVRDTRD